MNRPFFPFAALVFLGAAAAILHPGSAPADPDSRTVIANTFNPYWRAEVDGRHRALIRVNHAQSGLLTYPAERLVRLVYAPPYWPRGALRWTRPPTDSRSDRGLTSPLEPRHDPGPIVVER